MTVITMTIIIENNGDNDDNWNDNNDSDNDNDNDNKNNNTNDNDENNDNDVNNKIPMDSPHTGPIMQSFDVTFVESKNNSWVSGDLRRHTLT